MGFIDVWQSAGRHVALKKARELAKEPHAPWRSGVDAYADHLHANGLLQQFVDDAEQPTTLPVNDYLDGLVATKAVRWIEGYERREPFFLWVNFSGPHGPYNPPAEYLSRYEPSQMPPVIKDSDHADIPSCMRPHEWRKSEAAIPIQRVAYAGMISFIDEQVGRILDAIERKGMTGRTVVAFFSDHGIMEGDHGLMHKETLYKEVLKPASSSLTLAVHAGNALIGRSSCLILFQRFLKLPRFQNISGGKVLARAFCRCFVRMGLPISGHSLSLKSGTPRHSSPTATSTSKPLRAMCSLIWKTTRMRRSTWLVHESRSAKNSRHLSRDGESHTVP